MVAEPSDPETAAPSPAPRRPPRRPRVVVFYNYTALSAAAEVPEPPAAEIAELRELLAGQGYEAAIFNAEDSCDRMGDAVVLQRPDIILNLVDHFHGDSLLAGSVAGMLEIFEYPLVGGDALCVASCADRLRTHLMLRDAGVPCTAVVPVWDRDELPDHSGLRAPVILTQSFDDIYHRAGARPLLADAAEIEAHAAEVLPAYDLPFLLEEYVSGRRLSAVIAGAEVLPPTELWKNEEGLWLIDVAELGEARARVIEVAARAAHVAGCRDLAQIDMVLPAGGEPLVTDVRPAPTPWHEDSPLRVAAAETDGGLGGAVAAAIESALARLRRQHRLAPEL